jgi:hypothetical protein
MDAIIQFCQPIFQPLVLVFTVSNLLVMGLQVNLGQMFRTAANPKFLGRRPRNCISDHTFAPAG